MSVTVTARQVTQMTAHYDHLTETSLKPIKPNVLAACVVLIGTDLTITVMLSDWHRDRQTDIPTHLHTPTASHSDMPVHLAIVLISKVGHNPLMFSNEKTTERRPTGERMDVRTCERRAEQINVGLHVCVCPNVNQNPIRSFFHSFIHSFIYILRFMHSFN